MLWKVTSATNTVYIAGSIHLLKKDAYPLPQVYDRSFAQTKGLVLEVDPAAMNTPAAQKIIIAKALYPPGDNLQKSLAPKTYALVEQTAKELGQPMESINRFRPWFVAVTLTTSKLQKMGFNADQGIDLHFYNMATRAGKPVKAFETVDFQIDIFADMPPATQELMLKQALADISVMENEFNNIISAWESGDVPGVEKMLLESFKEFPRIYERIIASRNRAWLKKITGFLKGKEPFFIVVGAGHLVGHDGLINQLRTRHYTVQQL